MKKIAILLITCFVLTGICGHSQDLGFDQGTIIYKTGDSTRCLVRRALFYERTVPYKNFFGDSTRMIKLAEIKAIRSAYRYQEMVDFGEGEQLLTLVYEGRMRLYTWYQPVRGQLYDRDWVPSSDNKLVQNYVVLKTGQFSRITEDGFKKKILALVDDCPKLTEQVASVAFKYKNLASVVYQYNGCF
jgi:hypothetical protein